MKRYMSCNKRYDHVCHRGPRYIDLSQVNMVIVMVYTAGESEKHIRELVK